MEWEMAVSLGEHKIIICLFIQQNIARYLETNLQLHKDKWSDMQTNWLADNVGGMSSIVALWASWWHAGGLD